MSQTGIRISMLAAAAALLAAMAQPAAALDRIERRSTPTAAQGEIGEITRTSVTIKSKTKPAEEIPANDIVAIRWDGEPAGLNLNRIDEAGGRLEKALAGYTTILGALEPSRQNLRTDVEYLIARTTAKLALSDPAKLKEAAVKLEAFRSAHPTSYRYFEALDYLGRVYFAQNDAAKANSVYQALGDAPWPEYKMSGKLAEAALHASQGQFDEAVAGYDSVIATASDDPAAQEKRREAILGKAATLAKQQKFDPAAKLVESMIYDLPLENTRLQAEAYLRLGDVLDAAGKTKEAVLAYLHVDVLFAAEKSQHAEALFHLSRLWASLGYADRAADASARLKQEHPDSPWAQKVSASRGA